MPEMPAPATRLTSETDNIHPSASRDQDLGRPARVPLNSPADKQELGIAFTDEKRSPGEGGRHFGWKPAENIIRNSLPHPSSLRSVPVTRRNSKPNPPLSREISNLIL